MTEIERFFVSEYVITRRQIPRAGNIERKAVGKRYRTVEDLRDNIVSRLIEQMERLKARGENCPFGNLTASAISWSVHNELVVQILKTILVECITPYNKSRMNEANDIAKTAGYEVVGQVIQHRDAVDARFCVGEGKIGEIAEIIQKEPVDAVAFAQQLSAGQVFRIKKKLGGDVRILDRNLLILEVFEKRGATAEAKLQVALARLRYTFSWGRESIRMRGIVSEQMGRGGPGRYPYEVYEAMSRKRISKIEGELREIRLKQSRLRTRRAEAGFQIVALTGYTQSGKTTLFNRLASESKEVGLGPFTTLSSFARKISTESGYTFIMVDSIGFIEELNPLLLNAFRTTLNELSNSDLVLLFVDGSDDIETVVKKTVTSHDAMQKEVPGVPILVCVNKIDIAPREHLDKVLKEVRKIFETEEIMEISSKTGANESVLLSKIGERLDVPSRFSSSG